MERKNITKENSYFTKELETMSIEQIKKLQFEKTKETLKKAYHKSQFYRELFDRAKVKEIMGKRYPLIYLVYIANGPLLALFGLLLTIWPKV